MRKDILYRKHRSLRAERQAGKPIQRKHFYIGFKANLSLNKGGKVFHRIRLRFQGKYRAKPTHRILLCPLARGHSEVKPF